MLSERVHTIALLWALRGVYWHFDTALDVEYRIGLDKLNVGCMMAEIFLHDQHVSIAQCPLAAFGP